MTEINVLHCSRTLSFLITPDDLECQVGGWQKEGGVTEKDCEICGHLALAMATKELAHDYGEEMTTIEVMDADGVRAELDAVSESVMDRVREYEEETTIEFVHVWNAIKELRVAVETLCERVNIEHPEWKETLPQ